MGYTVSDVIVSHELSGISLKKGSPVVVECRRESFGNTSTLVKRTSGVIKGFDDRGCATVRLNRKTTSAMVFPQVRADGPSLHTFFVITGLEKASL